MINPEVTIDSLNQMGQGNMVEHLGIVFTEVGKDYLCAKMPVDQRTKQPLGLLHGGASVALAETLGSVAAHHCVDNTKHYCVGLEINANHIRAMRKGYVYGMAHPIHVGKKTQVWEIRITNEDNKMVCISRITLAVLDK
jgi:1,4-dihydroxy-2-naphthoyl-CoA hydrolase